ncbi:repeat protein [Moumouvirus goulette]|uniref:Repeat protein n=1 Tax=Moumouvirus goulette TaxID=1247379 RepID=M1PB52_9VIRU|nr:repeat protein [Moumouvirus goulette]AGF85119.1 repeat protein [Moumouvirus goulette]
MNIKFLLFDHENLSFGLNIRKSKFLLQNINHAENQYLESNFMYVISIDLYDNDTNFEKNGNGYRYDKKNINEYKCDKINVLEKYSLFDSTTYQKFNFNKIIIHFIGVNIEFDYINKLKYIYNLGIEIIFLDFKKFIDWSSANNKINVLDWFLTRGFKLKYTDQAIDNIYQNSEEKAMEIFKWWLDSGLKIKYTRLLVDSASVKGYYHLLDTILNSGIKVKYSNFSIDHASQYGKIEVLNWWLNSGLKLKYSNDAIIFASYRGKINVLKWWLNSGLELKYTKEVFKSCCQKNKPEIIEWWYNSGLIMDPKN